MERHCKAMQASVRLLRRGFWKQSEYTDYLSYFCKQWHWAGGPGGSASSLRRAFETDSLLYSTAQTAQQVAATWAAASLRCCCCSSWVWRLTCVLHAVVPQLDALRARGVSCREGGAFACGNWSNALTPTSAAARRQGRASALPKTQYPSRNRWQNTETLHTITTCQVYRIFSRGFGKTLRR